MAKLGILRYCNLQRSYHFFLSLFSSALATRHASRVVEMSLTLFLFVYLFFLFLFFSLTLHASLPKLARVEGEGRGVGE